MDILDIHTHHFPSLPKQAIFSSSIKELYETVLKVEKKEICYYSAGIHPWDIEKDNETAWESLLKVSTQKAVVAIGEAGLDKLASAPMPLQEKIFKRQIELAESVKKPLIIHTVHTFNEIIQIKKQFHPSVAWIIHGFRGKKEMALQLLNHGFYLSFGVHYAKDALQITPTDRLFLETDESSLPIHILYEKAARLRSLPTSQFISLIQKNIQEVFSL